MHLCIWIGAAIANNDQPVIQIDGVLNGRQLWQRSGFRAKPIATPSLRPMGCPARIDHLQLAH
jgi:hypothetical protein